MKRSPLRVAVPYLAVVAAIFVLIGLKLTLWSGPTIVIRVVGPEVEVDTTFLGEYHLGLDRVRINNESSSPAVVDARDPGGRLPNVFRLRAGRNELGAEAQKVRFVLEPGKSYVVTVCGNNGWARSECSSRKFTLPAG